jgi:hypothetical protein
LAVLTFQIFAKGGYMPLVEGRYVGFFLLRSFVVFAVNVMDELLKDILLIAFETKVFLDLGID